MHCADISKGMHSKLSLLSVYCPFLLVYLYDSKIVLWGTCNEIDVTKLGKRKRHVFILQHYVKVANPP